MDLLTLRTEVQARGFDFDPSSRVDRWLNLAYQRVCDRWPWPFLETTSTGAAPLTISDLRAVLSVVDSTADNVLESEDFRTIREADPNLDVSGSPDCWYLDGAVVKVYPTSTNSLSVRYVKVPTDLSADGDTPLLPSRYHYVIVDGAVAEAYKDSDNFEAHGVINAEFERGINEMVNVLLVPNYDTPASLVTYGASSDW